MIDQWYAYCPTCKAQVGIAYTGLRVYLNSSTNPLPNHCPFCANLVDFKVGERSQDYWPVVCETLELPFPEALDLVKSIYWDWIAQKQVQSLVEYFELLKKGEV